MSDAKKYYCFCDSNCKYETMSKEQILAAITQAVESGEISDVDAGFITKVKEKNVGGYVTFWVGTKAQYNALESHEKNCLYIITDDTAAEDMKNGINTAITKAEAAQAAADKMKAVNISNDVTLTVQLPISISFAKVTRQRFIYDPNTKIVYFSFDINIVDVGVSVPLVAGDVVNITQTGGYTAAAECPTRFFDTNDRFTAHVLGDTYCLKVKEDLKLAYGTAITFSGWYFCNGEG